MQAIDTRKNQWLVLAGFILVPLAVGMIGGLAIAKPDWTPPDWIFAPVWTALFIMMAVAAWLVWRAEDRVKPAMVLFFSQLALNLAWSFLFFGARSPGMALMDIAFLWLTVLATMLAFFDRSKLAGWLFVPYLAWVSFAALLNFTIWRMN